VGYGFRSSTQPTIPEPGELWALPTLLTPLLALNESVSLDLKVPTSTSAEGTIGHDGISENAWSILEVLGSNSNKVGSTKVSTFIYSDARDFSISEIGIDERGTIKISSYQKSINKATAIKDGTLEVSGIQAGSVEVGIIQNTAAQSSSIEIGTTQVNTTQIEFKGAIAIPKFLTDELINPNPTQINSTEIPLSGCISLQQFLSSHNYALQNTTVPTWTSFLQGPSPFNLNIKIADLPTGQLAEATITGFDTTGYLNAGTLYLDTDANGLGWYNRPHPGTTANTAKP
jgi:hypothetical protein